MPRVLIVASSGLVNELAGTILWRRDVERVVALSRDQGLHAVQATQPDLVILSDEDQEATIGVLRSIRSDPRTRGISVAVTRQQSSLAEEAALREAGANVVFSGDPVPHVWDAWLEELLNVPRRREVRVPVQFAVWAHASPGDRTTEGMSVNISTRGMLMETQKPVDLGARLDLSFSLPGDVERLRAVGQVMREDMASGRMRYGTEFLTLRETAREKIRAFVESARVD